MKRGRTPIALSPILMLLLLPSCNEMTDQTTLGRNPNSPPPTPTATDSDADGISDNEERAIGTNPTVADTDLDGFDDGLELVGTPGDPLDSSRLPSPLVGNERVLTQITPSVDADRDGIADSFESSEGLNPTTPDTDGDGYSDSLELIARTDPFRDDDSPEKTIVRGTIGTEVVPDQDGDGLANDREQELSMSPTSFDSDGDGFNDGVEYVGGSDALDERSIPNFQPPAPPSS